MFAPLERVTGSGNLVLRWLLAVSPNLLQKTLHYPSTKALPPQTIQCPQQQLPPMSNFPDRQVASLFQKCVICWRSQPPAYDVNPLYSKRSLSLQWKTRREDFAPPLQTGKCVYLMAVCSIKSASKRIHSPRVRKCSGSKWLDPSAQFGEFKGGTPERTERKQNLGPSLISPP